MSQSEVEEANRSADDPCPSLAIVLGGGGAIALVSGIFLPWPMAIASTVLGTLMVAGADVDARTYLLPDLVTWGAAGCGIAVAPLLETFDPWLAVLVALARALAVAAVLELLRRCYAHIRKLDGLGFGDVKLAAAVGAWLPLDLVPVCFGLATSAALVAAMAAHLRGQSIEGTMKLPFGAFLCPALWLVFFANILPW